MEIGLVYRYPVPSDRRTTKTIVFCLLQARPKDAFAKGLTLHFDP